MTLGHVSLEKGGLKFCTAFTKFEYQLTSIYATWPLKSRPAV